ncbi:hypothetical protein N7492_005105, partial [Penicillium capsulatum]
SLFGLRTLYRGKRIYCRIVSTSADTQAPIPISISATASSSEHRGPTSQDQEDFISRPEQHTPPICPSVEACLNSNLELDSHCTRPQREALGFWARGIPSFPDQALVILVCQGLSMIRLRTLSTNSRKLHLATQNSLLPSTSTRHLVLLGIPSPFLMMQKSTRQS